NDVWAAGSGGSSTLTEHWDGKSWTRVPSPNPGAFSNRLTGLAAVSSDDIWAAGMDVPRDPNISMVDSETFILHWDGQGWTQSPSPSGPNFIGAMAAASRDSAWAIGGVYTEGISESRL